MANPEHLEILQKGVKAWNAWREENPEIQPDLRHAHLSDAVLSRADLSEADFYDADLSRADLREAFLSDAVLSDAVLSDAVLSRADLSEADFYDADLSRADLREAFLFNANFNNTTLSSADFTNCELGNTIFGDIDLSETKGLESVNHERPSTIGIDTIYKSRGEIPEVFLRGCGVPENFITYMHSLTGKALDFYKCFISFTEADDMFSERLYNDLQARGVRCWRWKEDAKWGKTLMRSIDEAVRYYDKLIIICSEQSLNSPAVIREIERALQKEDELARQGKEAEVLFPIRLDDYVFNGWNHHRKADMVAKHIGDFRNWNEPEQYKKVFERLLRDLKADDREGVAGE